jgi:hypothetical protein
MSATPMSAPFLMFSVFGALAPVCAERRLTAGEVITASSRTVTCRS